MLNLSIRRRGGEQKPKPTTPAINHTVAPNPLDVFPIGIMTPESHGLHVYATVCP